MAKTCRICSSRAGPRYSTKRINDLIAARRALRVVGLLPRSGLEGGEEVHHQRGVDVLQSKTRRRDAKAPTGELKHQLTAVGIALTGMGAGPSLVGQTVAQKCADMRCDCCHTRSPYTNASQHWVISTISSGVLSKYQ